MVGEQSKCGGKAGQGISVATELLHPIASSHPDLGMRVGIEGKLRLPIIHDVCSLEFQPQLSPACLGFKTVGPVMYDPLEDFAGFIMVGSKQCMPRFTQARQRIVRTCRIALADKVVVADEQPFGRSQKNELVGAGRTMCECVSQIHQRFPTASFDLH